MLGALSFARRTLAGTSEVFKRYLMHDRLWVRFGALLGVVMAIFVSAWTLSYFFLPEGVLRGHLVGQVIGGDGLAGGSVWLEWLRILAINLGFMLLLVVAPNVFRTNGDYPLGYWTVTLLAIVLGITLGTNSFSFPLEGGKIPPTVAVFGYSGLCEITAYVLAVAATASISKYRLVGKWPKQTIVAIVPPQAKSMIQERNVGILLAITILLIACGWEAHKIASYYAS
jgi:hypothetical protein